MSNKVAASMTASIIIDKKEVFNGGNIYSFNVID